MNESRICNKKLVLLQFVKVEIAVHDQLFCRHQHLRKPVRCYSETRSRSRSNVNGAYTERQNNVIKLTFQSGLVTFYTHHQ